MFAALAASAGAAAVPSFAAGANPSPVVGVFDAAATVADEAAGGVLLEAQAAASGPASNSPQYFFIFFFLQRAWARRSVRLAIAIRGESCTSNNQTR